MKLLVSLILIAISLSWVKPVNTSMTGGDFEIYADSFNVISTVSTTGGDFIIFDTAGESFATTTSGNSFELRAGFQAMEKGTFSFSISSGSVNLGALTKNSVSSGNVTVTVSTNDLTGYSVSISEDGDLRSGTDVIDDVTDGSVTAGSEEYGISTSGAAGLLSSDTAISNGLGVISYGADVIDQETTVSFKVSVNGDSTPAGTYSHTVTFSGTSNP